MTCGLWCHVVFVYIVMMVTIIFFSGLISSTDVHTHVLLIVVGLGGAVCYSLIPSIAVAFVNLYVYGAAKCICHAMRVAADVYHALCELYLLLKSSCTTNGSHYSCSE